MSEETRNPANIPNPELGEHRIVSPLQYSLVFATLLIGTAITVIAAKMEIAIFKPVL